MRETALYSGPAKVKNPGNDMSVMMAASMVGWLTEQYGFDTVTAWCFGQTTLEKAFGQDFAALKTQWAAWLDENYTP